MEVRSPELTCPPERLEWLVQVLIPPAAREAVAGDLRELYRSPSQYIAMAARTIPFVLIGHIRRNANPPVLAIQGFFIFCCLMATSLVPAGPGGWTLAVLVSAFVLAATLLADAYQEQNPPSPKRAIIETIIVTALVVMFVLRELFALRAAHRLPDGQFGLFMWAIVPFTMPVLSGLRAMMVLARERREQSLFDAMEPCELKAQYRRFQAQTRLRNCLQSLLLLGASAGFAYVCATHVIPAPALAWSLVSIYAVVGAYLLIHGAAVRLPDGADFLSLRSAFQSELSRQHEIRRLILWLWPTPLLFAIFAAVTTRPRNDIELVLMLYALPAAVLLCFFVAILNRERNGQIQEKIGILARMRQRHGP
ncbi:MAG: hypothetical protein J0I19_05065 [Alphaproteobacteria bacterium]|nr:hypothetical protein [Alphaproteobacteria bacterium]